MSIQAELKNNNNCDECGQTLKTDEIIHCKECSEIIAEATEQTEKTKKSYRENGLQFTEDNYYYTMNINIEQIRRKRKIKETMPRIIEKVEKTTKKGSYTRLKAYLHIGNKKYKVNQDIYGDGWSSQLRPEWNLTKTQLKKLLETYPNNWQILVKSEFDGMTDGEENTGQTEYKDLSTYERNDLLDDVCSRYSGYHIQFDIVNNRFKIWYLGVKQLYLKFNGSCYMEQ
jgi:hypothetical protein